MAPRSECETAKDEANRLPPLSTFILFAQIYTRIVEFNFNNEFFELAKIILFSTQCQLMQVLKRQISLFRVKARRVYDSMIKSYLCYIYGFQ